MIPAAPAVAPLQLMKQAPLQLTRLQQILWAVQRLKLLSVWPVATRRWSTWRMTLKMSPPFHRRHLMLLGRYAHPVCWSDRLRAVCSRSVHDLECLPDWRQSWTACSI